MIPLGGDGIPRWDGSPGGAVFESRHAEGVRWCKDADYQHVERLSVGCEKNLICCAKIKPPAWLI